MRREQVKTIKKAARFAIALFEASPNTAAAFGMDADTVSKLRRIEPTLIEPASEPDPAKEWRSIQEQARRRLYKYAKDCPL